MQPEQTAPASAAPDVSMTDSVIGGNVSTTNIYVTQNNGIQWPAFALVAAALILASIGMMTDAWAVQEESVTVEWAGVQITTTVETEMGLDDITTTQCTNGECELVDEFTYDLGTKSDNCTDQAEDANLTSEQTEEMCGKIQDSANAGLAGMIFITFGILVMLSSLVAVFMETRGKILPFSQYYPFVGAVFILIGIITWKLILPEGDATLGYSARLAITSVLISSMAGIYLLIRHKLGEETKNRSPGLGVRTLETESSSREFVVRETASGNHTLSIVEDGTLFRLSKSIRSGDVTSTEDIFVTRIDALSGFTHARYDWLDKTKYLWNILAVIGLTLTIVCGSLTWVLFFAVGLFLSLVQFADPELITFETNTGKHRLLIYRTGSNRTLTNVSMNHIDSAMREMLSGNEIDTTNIDEVAQQIEDDLAELKAASESAEATKQAAQLEAQAMAQAQAEMQAQAMAQAQVEMQAQMQAQAEMQAQQAAAIPSTPSPAAPAAPAPVPPVMNPPPAPAAPPPVAAASPAPVAPAAPPPAPMPPPAGAATPLPPLPSNLDPNLVAEMGMPTETITPAPEIPMQAAPRDESLSEGEKENILTDLGED